MRRVATYEYRTAGGKLAFSKDRYESTKNRSKPKDFKYRWPNGTIVKPSELSKLSKLLYRLPQLIASGPTVTAFIAEGEKDCDALAALDLVATCNYDGAGKGKWQSQVQPLFPWPKRRNSPGQ
jgi:hypothetical protein